MSYLLKTSELTGLTLAPVRCASGRVLTRRTFTAPGSFSWPSKPPRSRILSKIDLEADLLFTRVFGRLATSGS